MDNLIGTLYYKITGDTKALDKSLDISRDKLSRTGKSLENFGQSAKNIATKFISVYLVKSLLDSASAAVELENKFKVVFSGITKDAEAFAKTYAAATSRGVIATKTFLATQQDIRTGFGDTNQAAAKFSQAVLGVTNDLASFSNIRFEDASNAIASGLAGQFEALRRLGVGLNVAIINEGNYARALNKSWEEMNNLQRQEAILTGIMQQSKNAIHQSVNEWKDYDYTLGDTVRTSKEFANSSQGLTQRLEDLKTDLAQGLLPLVNSLVNTLNLAINVFLEAPDPIKAAAAALAVLGVSLKLISGPIGWVVAGIASLSTAISYLSSDSKSLDEITSDLISINTEYNSVLNELKKSTENLSESEKALLENREKLLKSQLSESLLELSNSFDKEERKIRKLQDEYDFLLQKKEDIKNYFKYNDSSDLSYYDFLKYREANKANLAHANTQLIQSKLDLDTTLFNFKKSIIENGLNINDLNLNKDLVKALNAIDMAKETVNKNTKEIDRVLETSNDKLKSLYNESQKLVKDYLSTKELERLSLLKDKKEYSDYEQGMKSLIEDSYKVKLQELAINSEVADSKKDLSKLSISELEKIISANKEADKILLDYKRLAALEEKALIKEISDLKEEDLRERNRLFEESIEREANRVNELNKKKSEALILSKAQLQEFQKTIDSISYQAAIENSDFKKALEIQLDTLRREESALIESYNKRLEAKETSEEELFNITKLYANKRLLAQQNMDKAMAESAKEGANLIKEQWKNAAASMINDSKTLGNNLITIFANATEKQIRDIDSQTEAKLASLGLLELSEEEKLEKEYKDAIEKGDMELAKEKLRAKERLRIEKEADNQKRKLQIEQAKRERDLKIFSVIIDTASAIVKALADPGGYAGIALSVMAGVIGATQVAAIASAPLPAFAAGSSNIPSDMVAQIHQGEMILPKPFSEAVRRGEVTVGKNVSSAPIVKVTVINNSNMNVDVKENEDEIFVTIGSNMERHIIEGRFDDALATRYGVARRGVNA